MPPLRFKRKNHFNAPATVHYHKADNAEGKAQLCVFAECQYGGGRAGPVWGHTDAAVRRALATLTKLCPCRRMFHSAGRYSGIRIIPKEKKGAGKK